ncbi:MAG: IS66 family insertion sequence element accessory protein TnpA, partial [Methylovulum sp.]
MSLSTGWIQHIEAWQRSGLKQAAYCRQQNLNYHTFSARLCDYRK